MPSSSISRSSTYRPPSQRELEHRRENLYPADYGVVHPELPGIRTRRETQSGDDFADFTRDVRESTHTLMRPPVGYEDTNRVSTGRRMMTELDSRTAHLNPGATPTPYRPSTSVNIYSGRGQPMPNRHAARHEGTYDSLRPAYRYEGQASSGRPSDIRYDESGERDRHISLGHEMVHGWRTAHGVAVSPLAVSPYNNDPVFARTDPQFRAPMRETIEDRLRLSEEFETVGLRQTPHTPGGWAPTENAIRQERGAPLRYEYSGSYPDHNQTDDNLRMFDEGSDDRRFYERAYRDSPIGGIVRRLER
ncbi:hypothetical protein CYFUS_008411 [Cystobacter fuscus]|uniref:Uncharacterized protein n=1 Tax=Cystobacter fuscus TaxID=43 RepID=A0A250JHH9_9BACT|nr:M91 family zinc metallopeptidase [Cystobacter fuscus]ATB42932.1 hypothetical protein CYFUS_008411 [Cystobacter fuscus]